MLSAVSGLSGVVVGGCVFKLTDILRVLLSLCCLQATRHAELEAIDRILADHGGDVSKVQFHRYSCTALLIQQLREQHMFRCYLKSKNSACAM